MNVVIERAVDATYLGPDVTTLTPSELVAWMLWKLGA